MSEPPADALIGLARKHFGDDFDKHTPTDELPENPEVDTKFFTAMANGAMADYSKDGNRRTVNPEEAEMWGPERVLRANRIEWLCTNSNATALLSHNGIRIGGARIDGELKLINVHLDRQLFFIACAISMKPILSRSHFQALYCYETHCPGLEAESLVLQGDLHLSEGFVSNGKVSLAGSSIGGQFSCTAGTFNNPEGFALHANGIKVNGTVFLNNGFSAKGEVHLVTATVGGQFACSGGTFINNNRIALDANGIEVGSDAFLDRQFEAEGAVNLVGSKIDGHLICSEGKFSHPEQIALNAYGINVKQSLVLGIGFEARGEVDVRAGNIGGQLICRSSSFLNKGKTALDATGIKVTTDVILDNLRSNENQIEACGLFQVEGLLNFSRAVVGERFSCRGIESTTNLELDLRDATVGVFSDEKKSWPEKGSLFLGGFEYESLGPGALTDAEDRIEWLELDASEVFNPQPYERLAFVLSSEGHRSEARKIRVEREWKLSKRTDRGHARRVWDSLIGYSIDFGYRPSKAIPFYIAIILIGGLVYEFAYYKKWMTPTRIQSKVATTAPDPDYYPTFQGLAYSLDAFIPVFNLEQTDYRVPNAAVGPKIIRCGPYYVSYSGFVLLFFYFQAGFGWIATTTLALQFNRLMQRED